MESLTYDADVSAGIHEHTDFVEVTGAIVQSDTFLMLLERGTLLSLG